jgi:nucleotide-binding universal stress UspA family protein
MGCYRKILIALDGSPDAHAALRHAAELAHDQHAQLVVLTVVPPPVHAGGIGAAPALIADYASAFARELHDAVETLPHEIGVTSRLTKGKAAQRILEVADECCCDLIVMGFHGHGRLHHALRGSVSDTVVRESRRPVLLVRASGSPPPVQSLAPLNEPEGAAVQEPLPPTA